MSVHQSPCARTRTFHTPGTNFFLHRQQHGPLCFLSEGPRLDPLWLFRDIKYKHANAPSRWLLSGPICKVKLPPCPGCLPSRRQREQGTGLGGILHHVEHCVQLHCPKQQVAVKGLETPIVTALAAGERSVLRQDSDPSLFCDECHKVN